MSASHNHFGRELPDYESGNNDPRNDEPSDEGVADDTRVSIYRMGCRH